MDQQLIESTVELVPGTMDEVLPRLQAALMATPLHKDALEVVVKSLFYGVWNFDKMINQHLLNTRIAEMLPKLPRRNFLAFLRGMLGHLSAKWNLIDHHRINKFMQLSRYLLAAGFRQADRLRMPRRRIDAILGEELFRDYEVHGLACHFMDVYVPVWREIAPIGLADLALFEQLLTTHPNPVLRRYVSDHVYAPFKKALIEQAPSLDQLEEPLQECIARLLELAGEQEDDGRRKDLYTLVGFFKSEQVDFGFYYQEKQRKAAAEKEKRIRKMSRGKKAEVRRMKQKRREKKAQNSKHRPSKIMSRRKFEQ